jgi:hypothetical protein
VMVVAVGVLVPGAGYVVVASLSSPRQPASSSNDAAAPSATARTCAFTLRRYDWSGRFEQGRMDLTSGLVPASGAGGSRQR